MREATLTVEDWFSKPRVATRECEECGLALVFSTQIIYSRETTMFKVEVSHADGHGKAVSRQHYIMLHPRTSATELRHMIQGGMEECLMRTQEQTGCEPRPW